MLRFMDSFDHVALADLDEKYDIDSGTGWEITAGAGRWGSKGLVAVTGNAYLGKGLQPVSNSTGIFGCAFKTTSTGQYAFSETYSSIIDDRPMVMFSWNVDGSISAWRASDSTGGSGRLNLFSCTLLGSTASGLVNVGTWNFIEWLVTHDSTSGVVKIAINGNLELELTGIDTQPNDREFTLIGFGNGSTVYDDVYMADGDPSGLDEMAGDCRIEVILPESDGTNSGLTPSSGTSHFAMVDDTAPNDDTDYLHGLASGLKDTWNYQVVSGIGEVLGVQVNINARKDSAGLKQLAAIARVGGSDELGDTLTIAAETYKYYRQIFEKNPDTAAAWTISEINAAEFGVQIIT